MKNIYFLLLLTILAFPQRHEATSFVFTFPDSLNTSDSLLAENYRSKADSLKKISKYDSAIVYYEKAAAIYENIEDWDNFIYCLSIKGFCYYKTGEYATAIEIFENTKILIPQKINQKNISMVRILANLGAAHMRLGEYMMARKYLNEAKILANEFENLKDLKSIHTISGVYQKLGIVNFETGNYEEALNNFQRAIDYSMDFADSIPVFVGNLHNSLAIVYTETGYFDEAMANYIKAQKYYFNSQPYNLEAIAFTYLNMAILISESRGDYDEALKYQDKALSILMEKLGEEHIITATAYYNKGDFLFKKGDSEGALYNFDKALSSYKSVFNKEENTDIAMTYNSIGEVYESLSNYNNAYVNYEKALSIRLSIFGEQHADVAKNYNDLGSIDRIQKKYAGAIRYHEDALSIFKQAYGERHPNIAESYNLLGLVYRDLNKFDMSLQNFQYGLMANVPSFSNLDYTSSPAFEDIMSEPKLLETLGYKAETLNQWYNEDNTDLNLLVSAFDTYKVMADLIDRMRSGHKAEGSKLFLAQKSSEIFEKAIETSIQLYELSGAEQYNDEAYVFCERSKARILQEAMNESRARNFSGIPDSLLEQEKHLKTDLTFYENQLQHEKYKKDNIDSIKIKEYENRLFDMNREYQQLVADLELNYPKYYSSKYFNKSANIEDVQRTLQNDEALLEYFAGSEAVYLFYISKSNYEIITIDINQQFKGLVEGLYSSINIFEKKEYLAAANQLYNLLLKPAEHHLTGKQKLIIIPDGDLYYIPFEALITKVNPDNLKDFSNQNYVINNHEIVYNYSASFLTDTPGNLLSDKSEHEFIGFAPVFKSPENADLFLAQNTRSIGEFASDSLYRFLSGTGEIKELPYSEEELKYILDLFEEKKKPAAGYFYKDASKEKFQAEAGKYKYVHLATHSFVNPEKPRFSGIILSHPEDTTVSGSTIYSNEIYNLDLNADLVVLSSCESGIGKLVKGEGMMALTRGFLYAGADNIITSLWKVFDKSTSDLMKNFYRNVLESRSYSSSLREAKLEMIRTRGTSFPLNWSGFVLIGR